MIQQPSIVDLVGARPVHHHAPAIAIVIAILLSLASVAPVLAGHTFGTLTCGSATFEVDGQPLPDPAGFEAPGPWSGLFLLEGTTQVFKAFSITGQAFPYPAEARYPHDLVTCTLTSAGAGISWTLEGVFRP